MARYGSLIAQLWGNIDAEGVRGRRHTHTNAVVKEMMLRRLTIRNEEARYNTTL